MFFMPTSCISLSFLFNFLNDSSFGSALFSITILLLSMVGGGVVIAASSVVNGCGDIGLLILLYEKKKKKREKGKESKVVLRTVKKIK